MALSRAVPVQGAGGDAGAHRLALLLLACSYWKMSGNLGGGRRNGGGDADAKEGADAAEPAARSEERILVIMAGDEKPTYLATPISSRASSFGHRPSKDEADGDEMPDVIAY